ncbi:MAG: molybdopterin molybdotransferase MoeA [bacterium]
MSGALLPVEAARALILDRVTPLGPVRLPLERVVDRVLAEAVDATRALPAFDDSAMDGYAVRAAECTPGRRLPVVGEVAAGAAGDAPVEPGTAVRIFTGAPVPPGADAILIQEDTRRHADAIEVLSAVAPGANIRRAGTDVEPGQRLLEPGRILTPGDVALLGALGRTRVDVYRAPVVAILSSGDELVEPDGPPPARGQVTNSNGIALAAAVRALGAEPRLLPVVRDDADAVRAALLAASRADAVLTVGGMSVGDHDHLGRQLSALCGADLALWRVAIRPGKPLGFGRLKDTWLFGLPGNPVSALVTFEVFVRPALLRLLGHDRVLRRLRRATLAHPLPAGGQREEYRRAALSWRQGRLEVDARRTQSSGALSSLAGADALLVLRAGARAQEAGETVDVLVLGPDSPLDRLSIVGG